MDDDQNPIKLDSSGVWEGHYSPNGGVSETHYAEAWSYQLSPAQKRFEAARMTQKRTRSREDLREMLNALKAWCKEEGVAEL